MNSEDSDFDFEDNDSIGLPSPIIVEEENEQLDFPLLPTNMQVVNNEELDFPVPPSDMPVVNNIDYSNYQDNYNQFYQMV